MASILARLRLSTWQTIGLGLLVLGTVGSYIATLGVNSYGNAYYATATMPGSRSLFSAFFGSVDLGNGTTIDKSPLALWPIDLSVKIFGLNSFGLFLPQVMMAGITVLILFFTVRRSFGYGAGMLAGLFFATTPVVALMFRYNNPDAVMTMLLTAAVAAAVTLNRTAHTRWAVLVGVFLGLAFLAKLLQGLIILPALGLVYLLFGRPRLAKRFVHLLVALISMFLASGWWFAIVALTPASARPYQSGTQSNSIWDLIIGYNGLNRLTGNTYEGKRLSVAASAISPPGPLRLLSDTIAGQASWLLPLALIVGVLGIILYWRQRQEDNRFFEITLWLATIVISYPVYSFMQGIFHPYYVVAMVPGIAALAGITLHLLLQKQPRWADIVLAITLTGSGIWAGIILTFTQDFKPLFIAPVLAGVGLGVLTILGVQRSERGEYKRLYGFIFALAIVLCPTFFSADTLFTKATGSNPLAGPIIGTLTTGPARIGNQNPNENNLPSNEVDVNRQPAPTPSASGEAAPLPQTDPNATPVKPREPNPKATPYQGTDPNTVDEQTILLGKYLAAGSDYRWTAAIYQGAQASNIQLLTGLSILPIGGYGGREPYPTLEQFQHYVKTKQIRYYLDTTPLARLNDEKPLTRWVRTHFYATSYSQWLVYDLENPIDGTTIYDLDKPIK